MAAEGIIRVECEGESFTAWKSAEVSAAMDEAARDFSLVAAAEHGGRALSSRFRAGAEVSIYADGDLLCKGFVDRYQPKGKDRTVTIGGRSKSQDAVDSSALHKKGSFKKKKPDAIGKEIIKETEIDVNLESDADDLEEIDYHIVPGETVFRAIEKMVRNQGKVIMGTAEGGMKITDASKAKKQSGRLTDDYPNGNFLDAEADHNWSNRHSKTLVRAQRAIGHGKDALELESIAEDGAVKRKRPRLIVSDDDTDKKRVKKRAKSARDKAAGEALTATGTVQGFRDEGGKLWQPNHLVWVESAFLNIQQDMLIKGVKWSKDENGSRTVLTLTDPRAMGGKKGKGSKSGSDWDQSDSEAS